MAMKVGDWMSEDVVTVSPKEGVRVAEHLMKAKGIRHLPVVRDGTLVGIVSDRDIRRVMPSPATSLEIHEVHYLLEKLQVADMMTREVITVTPETPIESAADLLLLHKVGALPVLDGTRLVGIISEADILHAFRDAGREGEGEIGMCWLADGMSGFRVSGSP